MIRQRRGRIINLSSQAAFVALPTESVYCMTKAAISHLTKCLAICPKDLTTLRVWERPEPKPLLPGAQVLAMQPKGPCHRSPAERVSGLGESGQKTTVHEDHGFLDSP